MKKRNIIILVITTIIVIGTITGIIVYNKNKVEIPNKIVITQYQLGTDTEIKKLI